MTSSIGGGVLSPAAPAGGNRGAEALRATAPRRPRAPARYSAKRLLAVRLAVIAAALLLWQLVVVTGVVPSSAIAAPTDIATSLVALAGTPAFWLSILATVRTWAIGLTISAVIAIPVGMLLGSSRLAYRLSHVSIDFLRTIPPVALIPLALLLYGATETMALVLIVFGSVWPLLLLSMYGVHQVDPVARDVSRSYRLRRRYVVLYLVVPSAAPFIATGLRIAATMSLLLAIGAELIGGAPGIGQSIGLAQSGGNIADVYAYIVVSAILGVILNLGMIGIERKALSWHSSNR